MCGRGMAVFGLTRDLSGRGGGGLGFALMGMSVFLYLPIRAAAKPASPSRQMAASVPPASAIRLSEISSCASAEGSVQNALPELTG